MASVVISTPAGMPSQIATRARPCDSPAVSQRSMLLILPCPWSPCFRARRARRAPAVTVLPGAAVLASEGSLGIGGDRDAPPQPAAYAAHDLLRHRASRLLGHGRARASRQPQMDRQ